jgi:arsenate reductase
MSVTIYHNPRCGKSREGLQIVEELGVDHNVRLYLKEEMTKEELTEVINKLGISPEDLLRKKESIFKENYAGKKLSDDEWISDMIEHPKLMERPIVVNGDKAIIGRPPALIKDIF